MKKIISLLFLLTGYFTVSAQDEPAYVCRYGFTFEISMQKNWGYAKPVVLTVTPNTSADAANIQAYDIIEEIDGRKTENQMIDTIINWMQNSRKERLIFTVSNLKTSSKTVVLAKRCTLANALTEKDLTGVYAFYSLEDAQNQIFTCPFSTNAVSGSDFKSYKTFGFYPNTDENKRELEKIINASIRTALEKKGLKFAPNNPDLLVNTHYSYNKNLNYRKNDNAEKLPAETRYDVSTRTMVHLPIYYNPLINSQQAECFLKLGIQLIDKKRSTDNPVVVWECEANELIQSGNYTLNEYAKFHIPLMLMQYPYIKSNETAKFHYSRLRYNYTGIHYNMDKLKEIIDIDRSSPASESNLQIGDKILEINRIKFNDNPKSVAGKYKQFIYKTMNLRDPETQYTNAEGFTECMFWDKFRYAEINREFLKSDYSTAFSYLFYFEPYVNLSGTNIVTFLVERGKQKIEVKIKPLIITETIFENVN
ncbi:MAG: DUF4136 domain-containing protein [Dysgonamonadaceae bacterium]|jgi:hypothetical protein|nr:DUF4136 domain-containing protein [Dysgonamonadaceae bacterium]